MARKQGKCVYCGELALTRDHIPPKCIFGEPLPIKLITVPCCELCRSKYSSDDEYFCHWILQRREIAHRPDIQARQPEILRALENPKKRGYSKQFRANVSLVQVRTLAGLYLGHMPTYTVDISRVNAVASRIVHGLHSRERRQRLPHTYLASAWSMDGFIPKAAAAVEREFMKPLLDVPARVVGNRVFAYRFADVGDGPPHTTAWLLRFFEKVFFFGFTVPPEHAPSGQAEKPSA